MVSRNQILQAIQWNRNSLHLLRAAPMTFAQSLARKADDVEKKLDAQEALEIQAWDAWHEWGTLWLFNIAMENGPFIDDIQWFSYWKWWCPMAMLNNQLYQ